MSPAAAQADSGRQLVAPALRLRQQRLPPEQAVPSTQLMVAPGQLALALMHDEPFCRIQQASTPGTQDILPHGIGFGGWPPVPPPPVARASCREAVQA